MPASRQSRSFPLALVAVLAAVVLVAACDTTSSFRPSQQRWGFVYFNALRTSAGEDRIAPTAQFFRGSVSSVPDARLRPDSCFAVGDYIAPSENVITGVTYLDAGSSISTNIGGVVNQIPRSQGTATPSYGVGAGSAFAYRAGDSAVVTIPGVSGGYPAAEIRARTSEPFTVGTIAPSSQTIPLTWTAATDNNSAMLISLRYTPAGSGARTQEIRCAFIDDGVDSIPVRQHQAWSASSNVNRAVVVTRLRTAILAIDGGYLETISTFSVPTPQP